MCFESASNSTWGSKAFISWHFRSVVPFVSLSSSKFNEKKQPRESKRLTESLELEVREIPFSVSAVCLCSHPVSSLGVIWRKICQECLPLNVDRIVNVFPLCRKRDGVSHLEHAGERQRRKRDERDCWHGDELPFCLFFISEKEEGLKMRLPPLH